MSENETAPSDVARIRFLIRAVTDAGFFDATPADRERFERIVAPTLPPALAAKVAEALPCKEFEAFTGIKCDADGHVPYCPVNFRPAVTALIATALHRLEIMEAIVGDVIRLNGDPEAEIPDELPKDFVSIALSYVNAADQRAEAAAVECEELRTALRESARDGERLDAFLRDVMAFAGRLDVVAAAPQEAARISIAARALAVSTRVDAAERGSGNEP